MNEKTVLNNFLVNMELSLIASDTRSTYRIINSFNTNDERVAIIKKIILDIHENPFKKDLTQQLLLIIEKVKPRLTIKEITELEKKLDKNNLFSKILPALFKFLDYSEETILENIESFLPYKNLIKKEFLCDPAVELALSFENDNSEKLRTAADGSIKSLLGFSDEEIIRNEEKFDWTEIFRNKNEIISENLVNNLGSTFIAYDYMLYRELDEVVFYKYFTISPIFLNHWVNSEDIAHQYIGYVVEAMLFQKWAQPKTRSQLFKNFIKTSFSKFLRNFFKKYYEKSEISEFFKNKFTENSGLLGTRTIGKKDIYSLEDFSGMEGLRIISGIRKKSIEDSKKKS